MIDDLNQALFDENNWNTLTPSSSLSTSQMQQRTFDENGPLRQQQDRLLFLGITNNIEKQQQPTTTTTSPIDDLKTWDMDAVFHHLFQNLLQTLQKNVDFDQILRWARTLIEKCIITVGFYFICILYFVFCVLYRDCLSNVVQLHLIVFCLEYVA